MDVAQALQEAHASMTEAETTSKTIVPPIVPRHVEPYAPPIEKRKSSFDKHAGRATPPLIEGRTLTTRGVEPTGVDVNPGARAHWQEQANVEHIPPAQQDDNSIEIRE